LYPHLKASYLELPTPARRAGLAITIGFRDFRVPASDNRLQEDKFS